MTMEQAMQHLVESDAFKDASKTDARLRVMLGRHKAGELKEAAKIALLKRFGYTITTTVKAPK